MNNFLRRLRGAVGMGLTWAVTWGITGLMIGVTSVLLPGRLWDTFFSIFDAPLPALAMVGFFAGAVFSLVLGTASRHRRFRELSIPRFAAYGAIAAMILCLPPVAIAAGPDHSLFLLMAVIGIPFTVLSAASAAATLALARRAEDRDLLEDSADVGRIEG